MTIAAATETDTSGTDSTMIDSSTVTDGATEADTTPDASTWWRQAVVYQIYPRSFADADGDGRGDLRGIIDHADYLADLGIDAVWMSPFYPSELADGGYDVSDYRDVDPRLGTLDDFGDLVDALHARGIKVVIDIVPNHTSDQHAWFKEALASPPGSPARARYVFRDGTGPNGDQPPTDWESSFGGGAWERVPDGQWYLHHFAVEQPDLDWSHPEVREDFLRTLRFWADRGADGFRVDVAHMVTKDLSEPLPSRAELEALPIDGNHPTVDRDDVHDVYASWRAVFNEYDPPRTAVAEAWVHPSRFPLYASPTGLGQAFNFDLLEADFDAHQFRTIVTSNLELARQSGSSSTWVLSNHDVVRHATRYGLPAPARVGDGAGRPADRHGRAWLLGDPTQVLDKVLGARRARAATLFMLGLPGSSYLYQGEELGMHEVAEISDDQRQDPTFTRKPGFDVGRDGCRVPLAWSTQGPSFGFGSGGSHLPQPAWIATHAVSRQDGHPDSTLTFYRQALALRRTLVKGETLTWVETGRADVLRYRRHDGWEVVTTFGQHAYPVDEALVLLSSRPVSDGLLPPEATAWVSPRA